MPCCCFVHRHGKTLSSRNYPIFFCSLHWRNLSLYNKITTTHFKLIRFWWKNVIKFRGKVYSNFFKFVQQLFFLSAGSGSSASDRCCLLRQTPTPPCHSSRPSIQCVKEIQLDELYPNYYWLISVVRRFAGGNILRHSCPPGAGSSKPVLWIIKQWQNSNGPFWNSCLISALNHAAEVFP